MTNFKEISPEELEAEYDPEAIEEAEQIEPQQVDNVNSPFSFLLANMVSGGGRSRSERIRSKLLLIVACNYFASLALCSPPLRPLYEGKLAIILKVEAGN